MSAAWWLLPLLATILSVVAGRAITRSNLRGGRRALAWVGFWVLVLAAVGSLLVLLVIQGLVNEVI